jgi:small subunit ribosomal protein S9
MTPTTKKESAAPKKAAAPRAKKPAAIKVVAASKKAAAPKVDHTAGATGSYVYAIGRRKSAIAQVRLYTTGSGNITVNRKTLAEYLPVDELQDSVKLPLKTLGLDVSSDVVAVAHGGGIRGQADAIKLGIARAALKINPDFRTSLKPLGVLTRDPREKERKKYGLKKARKSPQWAKR